MKQEYSFIIYKCTMLCIGDNTVEVCTYTQHSPAWRFSRAALIQLKGGCVDRWILSFDL